MLLAVLHDLYCMLVCLQYTLTLQTVFGYNWRQTLWNGAFESGNSIYSSRATVCAFQNAILTTFALDNELQRLGRCICEYLVHKSAPPRVKPYPNTTQHQHSAFVVLKHAFHAVWATCKTQRGAC